MRVAVFGATGTVGNALLPLLARRHDVVALSRRPQESNGVKWAVADATDENAVRRALDGVEVAYYLVHSLGTSDFEERDLLAARTVARRPSKRASVSSCTSAGSETIRRISHRICEAGWRRRSNSPPGRFP